MSIIESMLEKRVEAIFGLYESYGDTEYIGEPVSVLEHSIQSAQLAQQGGYDDDVILAAFFHDIGHLLPIGMDEDMRGFGHRSHERVGANYIIQNGFSQKIADLILNHVQAKRYLTFTNPEYFAKLSEASKETLKFQGGPMTLQEARSFERNSLFQLSLQMREWDEMAKLTDQTIPSLEELKEMSVKHLLSYHGHQNYLIFE